MKLTGLEAPLKNFNGEPITVAEQGSELNRNFTVKTALLNCLGSMKAEDGKQSIVIYNLGTRIYQHENVNLDADELMLLKKALEQNVPMYTSLILGQLNLKLEEL